jgi:hypothetical protein
MALNEEDGLFLEAQAAIRWDLPGFRGNLIGDQSAAGQAQQTRTVLLANTALLSAVGAECL